MLHSSAIVTNFRDKYCHLKMVVNQTFPAFITLFCISLTCSQNISTTSIVVAAMTHLNMENSLILFEETKFSETAKLGHLLMTKENQFTKFVKIGKEGLNKTR